MADISRKGIFQYDLVTLLRLIKTNMNGIMTKLDSDTGVTDVDYNSLWALAAPNAQVEAAGTGLGEGDKYDAISQMFADYNGVIAKLNADAGVGDTTYAALTVTIGEGKQIFVGMNQTDLITSLQTVITGIATLTAKLDSDTGVADTDYASTYDVTDTVDDSGA